MENAFRDRAFTAENSSGSWITLASKTVEPLASGHFTLYVVAGGLIALLIRYVLSTAIFSVTSGKPVPKNTEPPLLPYFLPIIGSLPITFLWDPLRFCHTYVFHEHTM